MLTFMKVYFYVAVFGIALRLSVMSFATYPRTAKYTLGTDVVAFILSAAGALWAAWLIWG